MDTCLHVIGREFVFIVEDKCFMEVHLLLCIWILLALLCLVVHLGLNDEEFNEVIKMYLVSDTGCLPSLSVHVEHLIKMGNADHCLIEEPRALVIGIWFIRQLIVLASLFLPVQQKGFMGAAPINSP